jgi:hypothetical protein
MKFSLDRNAFVAKKIGLLNKEIVLDIGCRDKILKSKLKGEFKYIGIDFSENIHDEEILIHNLETGIPSNIKKVDIITAIDVLEHLENIHDVYKQLFLVSNKLIIIALPNMAYYKFRINFMIHGTLSGKYFFNVNKQNDRHRWIPDCNSINKFIKFNTPDGWFFNEYNFITERKNNFIMYFLEKLASKIFPNLFVYEKIYFFYKKY